jgi:prepilin-type N-terminal cleavage/methylation domain-containing protein
MTRRGLTALELVVALAVLALAATIGTATLGLLADRREPLRESSSAVERSAAVRRTLVAWLEDAHAALSPFSGNTAAAFELLDVSGRGHDADELVFTTTAPTPLPARDAIVRLYVDSDDRTPERGLVAELTTWAGGPTTRIQLDSTVAEMDVRCLTDLAGSRRWVPSFLSPQVVPRGVELRLRAARGARLDPLLELPIRVVVEAGR